MRGQRRNVADRQGRVRARRERVEALRHQLRRSRRRGDEQAVTARAGDEDGTDIRVHNRMTADRLVGVAAHVEAARRLRVEHPLYPARPRCTADKADPEPVRARGMEGLDEDRAEGEQRDQSSGDRSRDLAYGRARMRDRSGWLQSSFHSYSSSTVMTYH